MNPTDDAAICACNEQSLKPWRQQKPFKPQKAPHEPPVLQSGKQFSSEILNQTIDINVMNKSIGGKLE
jgi:hypothetical protein